MRILIVEDNITISEMLSFHLTEAGFIVDTTASGREGSYLARTNGYDLIILDYLLPERNGLEICTDVRELGITTPILMISIKAETEDKVELLHKGVDDYVTKPFSNEEVLARVHALLRRPNKTQPSILTIADLKIDTAKQKVTRKNTEIYLTRKEFSLLEYLARNNGNVVSRSLIMEHVWNMDSDPFSNTIEAHIFNLRKKLAKGKKRLIRTVPGRGYKFTV